MEDYKYIQYGLNDFINKKKNILFVTGYSGSGKTTLSKIFSKQYDAVHVSLDEILKYSYITVHNNEFDDTDLKWAKDFIENFENHFDLKFISKINGCNSVTEKCSFLIKESIDACSNINRIIIEGIQIFIHLDAIYKMLINKPIILMNEMKLTNIIPIRQESYVYQKTHFIDSINQLIELIKYQNSITD